jgi:hypothetical protein
MQRAAILFAALVAAATVSSCLFWRGDPDAKMRKELLYQALCTSCHPAYEPRLFSDGKWRSFIADHAHVAGITPDEGKTITEYLTKNN